jgi:Rod binding domain-containing protein
MTAVSNNLLGISQLHAQRAMEPHIEKANRSFATQAPEIGTRNLQSKAQDSKDQAQIRQLSEDFEAIFLGMVLKSMRDSVQKSGLIDGGNAENIYRSMLDDEYAKQMAAQNHTGLANQIADFLSGQNELRGQKAYSSPGLPDDGKKGTIGVMKSTSIPSVTVTSPLPVTHHDPKLPKTP